MKRLLKKIEAALTAAAFAEEGEVETARQIMAEADVDARREPDRSGAIEATMVAAAFAEEGEVEAARRTLTEAGIDAPGEPQQKESDPPARAPSMAGRPVRAPG